MLESDTIPQPHHNPTGDIKVVVTGKHIFILIISKTASIYISQKGITIATAELYMQLI